MPRTRIARGYKTTKQYGVVGARHLGEDTPPALALWAAVHGRYARYLAAPDPAVFDCKVLPGA